MYPVKPQPKSFKSLLPHQYAFCQWGNFSLTEMALNPLFRRKWSSVSEALQDSQPDREQLMKLYFQQMSGVERPILAVDHTAWARPDAPTLRERTYEHQATAIHGNKPIAIGLGYSTIAWIPEAQGSWALPLRHERITRKGYTHQ